MKTKSSKFNICVLLTLILTLCFCLCGCAEVNFVTYHLDNGAIQEYVHLTLNNQTLQDHGYNPAMAKLEIKTDAYYRANLLLNQYKNKVEQQLTNNLITFNEYNALIDGVTVIEQNWDDNNVYIIGLQYQDSLIYKTYYQLMNNASFGNNVKKVKKLFYTKTYHYGTTNYGDYSIFNEIYNYYSNSKFAQISPQQTDLTYTYSVSSRRFHSDADKITLDGNGNYLHTWNVNPDEPARQIYFYTITANRSVWIITCIIIGLIVCAILGTIGLIKYRKNKKDENNKHFNNLSENN